ncbi:MAG: preprotein translocase subunit SecG [bacterium]
MVTLLTILFVILCIFLVIIILIQQGKGDMGLGGLGGGGQMLFGGSGGQDFFEKVTWIMGAIFIIGSLGLTILKTKEITKSKLTEFITTQQKQTNNIPTKNN